MMVRVAGTGSTRPVASVHVNVMGKTPAVGKVMVARVLHGRRRRNATEIPGEGEGLIPLSIHTAPLKRDRRIEGNDRVRARRVNDTAGWGVRRSAERLDGCKASTTPCPKLLSTPGVPRSTAATRRMLAMRVLLTAPGPPAASMSSAATAATCGAAAEVPKNGVKSGREVLTPSAAATSGLVRTSWVGKKSSHGPCELKPSSVSKPDSLHVDRPHRDHLTYARMAKDTATGDVVLEHRDPPKGIKMQ